MDSSASRMMRASRRLPVLQAIPPASAGSRAAPSPRRRTTRVLRACSARAPSATVLQTPRAVGAEIRRLSHARPFGGSGSCRRCRASARAWRSSLEFATRRIGRERRRRGQGLQALDLDRGIVEHFGVEQLAHAIGQLRVQVRMREAQVPRGDLPGIGHLLRGVGFGDGHFGRGVVPRLACRSSLATPGASAM